jgi:hypothetical protein
MEISKSYLNMPNRFLSSLTLPKASGWSSASFVAEGGKGLAEVVVKRLLGGGGGARFPILEGGLEVLAESGVWAFPG